GADVKSIYDNERGGLGYDGSARSCKCVMPVGEWRLDECTWSGAAGEVTDSSGNGLNGTALNGASTLPARVCMGGSFDGLDDAVRVPDSGLLDGTDAITLMMWIRPEQLYQANGTNARGLLSKRRSAGSDESYGLFFWNDHQMVDDDGDGDPDRARLYIDIDGNDDRFATNAYISKGVWSHVAVVYDGNRSAAGRVEVYINGQLDKTAAESSAALPDYASDFFIGDLHYPNQNKVFKGAIDEVKVFNRPLSAERILSIYTNESAALNYDGSSRVCADCPQPPLNRAGIFNAVDYTTVCSASLDWDDNLTTKRAGEAYRLSILAKEAESGLPMEANITQVDLYYFTGGDTQRCSGIPYRSVTICGGGCGVTDLSGCMALTVPLSLNDRAAACVQVHIAGKDINATASVDANESNSSDNYAVRPDRFLFLQPPAEANLTAEHDYFYAGGATTVSADGTAGVPDYNTSLAVGGIKRMRNGEANASLAGTFSAAGVVFADGSGDLNISFSDVADLTLTLKDLSWAAVDSDDTPLSDRRVYGEVNVTFIPHRFDVVFFSAPYIEDNDTAQHFTYLSKDLNMSAWARDLTAVVTAKGEKGGTLQNFSAPMDRLFADPVDVSPVLNLPAKHSAASSIGTPQPQTGADLNFSTGEAFLRYSDVPFNYDRAFDTPLNPFLLGGAEANISVSVTDATYPAVAGSVFSVFDGNATFYYGRLRAEDIATTYPSVENVAEIEVYDDGASPFVSGFVQNSLRWFRNEKQTSRSSGGIKEANATTGASLADTKDTSIVVGFDRYGSGTAVLEINNTTAVSKSRTIHLDIDPWLWYAPEGFGAAYDYGAASDCSMHPCFRYTYDVKGGGSGGVLSGDFNGSDFAAQPIDSNATFERKEGVKLFR
ncbi:LamG-like jellyroll fold domain-containing protein, partial [Hydrogenimonas sp.]